MVCKLKEMRIRILSDLHLEFGNFEALPCDADVVVLAGDIAEGTSGIEWAKASFSSPVIYVAGNHEFYTGRREPKTRAQILRSLRKAAAGSNVHFLDNESIEIGGVRFLCCTLWTDFEIYGDLTYGMAAAQYVMADFNGAILGERGLYMPADARKLHLKSKGWLTKALSQPWSGKTVVVTHFLPSRRSIAPRWANDASNAAFASNLDDLVGKADIWIHGHTHDSMDYELDGCQVICNPRGYVQSRKGAPPENLQFNSRCVLTVES